MKNWTHPSWCLSIFLLSHLNNINSFALNLMEPSIDGKIRKWRRTFSLKMGEQPKDFVIFLTNHHSIFFWNLPEFSRKTLRFLVAYQVEYSIIEKLRSFVRIISKSCCSPILSKKALCNCLIFPSIDCSFLIRKN